MSESATEVLRRMLDERGVEWWDSRYGEQVVFQVDGVKWFADDGCRDGMLELSTIAITPEQAIAATLGGGECELVEVDSYSNAGEVIHVLECSACGRTCEHVNGSYPKCPHCGRRAVKR